VMAADELVRASRYVFVDLPAQQDTGAAIRSAAPVVPIGPRRAGLMSAAHSGKFARTDFTKTRFAAAGPEHERSECERD
jgi:hypothetical protein